MTRRKIQLLLVVLLVAGTTETGLRASTDCERWIATYKAELAHTNAVRRLAAAKARVKRAAQRKLANYVKKPEHPLSTHLIRPKYNREQTLDRFNVLCGDLPEETRPAANRLMNGRMSPAEFASEMSPMAPIEMASNDGGFLPQTAPPAYDQPGTDMPETPPGGGLAPPIFGGGGYGGSGSGGGPGGGGEGPPGGGGTPPAIVPEPNTLFLLLTGVAGAAGAIRRRGRI